MTSTCYASIELSALRVAKLTTAGAPLTGATNGYVTDAGIQLGVTVEVDTGSDNTQKNGTGAICAALKRPDTVKRVGLALELCQLDSELLAMLTGGTVITRAGGHAIGMKMPAVGAIPAPVSIEAWSKAWDGGEQAVDTYTTPDVSYFHFVFPYVRWVQGQFTMSEGFMVVPVSGTGQENSRLTVNGPFDDWPTEVAQQGGMPRIGGWFLDDLIPTATCGGISVTSAAS